MRKLVLVGLALLLLAACGGEPTRSTSSSGATTTPVPTSGPNIPATATRAVELTQVAAALAPTATAGATATTVAAATPTQRPPTTTPLRPTVTATPGKVEVIAQGVTSYRDAIGGLWFLGELVNVGQEYAGTIQVAISLIGDTGQTLAAGSSSTFGQSLPYLQPGQKSVFTALIDKAPAAWKEERIQVQSVQVQAYERTLYHFDLKADGVTLDPPAQSGGVRASGQIVNVGTGTAKNVRVAVAMYDADGKLLRIATGYAKLTQIPPAGMAPFSVDAASLKQAPAKFEIYAYGQK